VAQRARASRSDRVAGIAGANRGATRISIAIPIASRDGHVNRGATRACIAIPIASRVGRVNRGVTRIAIPIPIASPRPPREPR
jgi:hypothetical protein